MVPEVMLIPRRARCSIDQEIAGSRTAREALGQRREILAQVTARRQACGRLGTKDKD